MFACDYIETYIYGRDGIQVEINHQPSVSIIKTASQQCTQPAAKVQLQQYNLNLKYKRGPTMYRANTLSQAYLHDVDACVFPLHSVQSLHAIYESE